MKTVLKVKFHSFVSLITNSSSEIFVAQTDKEEEAIEEILKELVSLYNKKLKFENSTNEFKFEDLDWWFNSVEGEFEICHDEGKKLPYELKTLIETFFGKTFNRFE